jgi:translation elongation factor P/translation initiation factor 5A
MHKSKPGKHGSAKCTLDGKNLLNDKKHAMTLINFYHTI